MQYFHLMRLPRTTRAAAWFTSFFRADLAMRGFAISSLTPASVALPDSFLPCFLGMHPCPRSLPRPTVPTPDSHFGGDTLPPYSLRAPSGNPFRVQNLRGSSKTFALCACGPQASLHPLH